MGMEVSTDLAPGFEEFQDRCYNASRSSFFARFGYKPTKKEIAVTSGMCHNALQKYPHPGA